MLRWFHDKWCFGRAKSDQLMWNRDIKDVMSMAVVQANSTLEDQARLHACRDKDQDGTIFVGVFDGHGGPQASRFVNNTLFRFIRRFEIEDEGLSTDVFIRAFAATEEEFLSFVMRELPLQPELASVGSCCLVGAISRDDLYIANLGDSRVVLGRKVFDGVKDCVVAERLSNDHNVACEDVRTEVQTLHPDDPTIVVNSRGGWRIKGVIQVSRSIGDVYLKKPELHMDPIYQEYANSVPIERAVLSAEPSVISRKLQAQDLFLIFASDGLWEHLNDNEAVDIVHNNPRTAIAKRLVTTAIKKAAERRNLEYKDIMMIEKGTRRHSHDDITAIVVYLDRQNGVISRKFKYETSVIAPLDIFSRRSVDVVDALMF